MPSSLLLLDPRNVAEAQDAAQVVGRVEKRAANPLFREDYFADPPKPWEARLDNVYPSVIYDEEEGIFKCWYKSFLIDPSSNGTPLAQRPHVPYKGGGREEGVLYADSADGIHWRKPELGLIEFAGTRQNNIVMRRAVHGIHAGGVLKDPRDTDPSRRYKFIHLNARAVRMASCFSADGFSWSQPLLWPERDAVGDTHNNAIWSPELERYICITRGWSDGAYRGLRTVLRSESEDFLRWSPLVEILRGADAHDQIYSMPIAYYGDLYLGLPAIFHKGDETAADWDRVDTELAISTDTLHWRRICPGQALIPRGAGSYPDGEHDCGCIYAAAPIVQGDKVLLYYGGSNGLHNGWREGSFNLATLPLDRFAGYRSLARPGKALLTTAPLRVTGAGITLNADIDAGGSIRAALIDVAGAALPGFGLDYSLPLREGGLALALRWRERTIAELARQPIRLQLELNAATAYAIGGATRADG